MFQHYSYTQFAELNGLDDIDSKKTRHGFGLTPPSAINLTSYVTSHTGVPNYLFRSWKIKSLAT
jgi:hypothetical protein